MKTRSPAISLLLSILLTICGCSVSPKNSGAPKNSGGNASTPAEAGQQAAQTLASFFDVPRNQLPHLRIVEVQKAVWTSTIHTTGSVDWDNDHTTQAITQVSGPIARLLVDYGAAVTANQPLLYVASPDLATAVSTYKKARNRQEFAKRTLDRSNDLLTHKVIAQKDQEAAQQDYNDASAETENDLQALKIFGVPQQEIDEAQRQGVPINSQLAVRSPITAMSTGIGSDSQRPFAIVIVGGLISRLVLSIFMAPVLYALVARKDDVLKVLRIRAARAWSSRCRPSFRRKCAV